MTPQRVAEWIAAVCELELPQQAICLRLAAVPVLPMWRAACRRNGTPDPSEEFLACFDRWLSGNASDQDFDALAIRLLDLLPNDLCNEPDSAFGFAGWALQAVAAVALDQCGDVHEDIVHTSLCYAAAAHCGLGADAVWVKLDRLSECELRYFADWWEQCRKTLPNLTSGRDGS
jgi:hypothetical protein